MNAIMNKTNNCKLFAAIIAIAMIVCAVAVVASPLSAEPGDSTQPYGLDGPVTVTNADGDVVENVDTLAKAIGQTDVTDAQTWTLAENAYYNVTKTVGEATGSGLVIPFGDITFDGNGSVVYADVSSSTSGYDSTNKMNMQSMLTIIGAGVTVKNLTVMTMYVPNSNVDDGWSVYKSIEVDGANAVIDNVKLVENTLAKGFSSATIDFPGYGGSIVPTVSGTTIQNSTITNGNINCSYLEDKETLTVTKTKITVDSDFVYGFNAIPYGSEEPTDTNVTYRIEETSVAINNANADAAAILNGTPAGTTVEVNTNVVIDSVTTTQNITIKVSASGSISISGEGSIDGDATITDSTGQSADITATVNPGADGIVNAGSITTYFSNGATVVTVTGGTINADVSDISGELILDDDVTIGAAVNGAVPKFTLTATGSISKNFDDDSFSAEYDGASTTFTEISGDITIAPGSVTVIGNKISDGKITLTSGTTKIYGEITGTLTIDGTGSLQIADKDGAGQTLTVAEGAELRFEISNGTWDISDGIVSKTAILDVKGTLTVVGNMSIEASTSTTNADGSYKGKIVTYPSTNLNNVTLSGNVVYETDNIAYEFKGMLDQDFIISTEQSLTGDLWIPDGVTLTIASGGVLNMAGYGIYVQGTLEIQANGAIKNIGTGADGTVFGKGTILLHRDGEIVNDGVIGSGSQVTVSADINSKNISGQPDDAAYGGLFANTDLRVNYNGVGSVIMQNVEGMSFDIINVNGTRYLTITGSIDTYGDAPNTVSASNVRITGELTIGEDVTFSAVAGVTLASGATVNVDGILGTSAGTFIMTNGSTVNVDGQVDGPITAETGKAASAEFKAPGTTTVTLNENNHVTGVVLTVGQISYVEDNVAQTEQILYISGSIEVLETGDKITATMTVVNTNGISYVAEGDVLDVDEAVTVDGGNTIVEGQVVYIDENSAEDVIGFNGTQYTIEGTSGADDVGYITSFEAAYGQIANAKDMTITILDDMTIEIDVDLAANQTIDLGDATVDIDTDATVEVQRDGTIDGKINDVQGVLISYNAGVTAPQYYAVYKKTADYTQWSGLVPAINNAQPGDVIDVRNDATVEDDLTIPAGVTVNNEAVLTFEEDLVIAETAVLNNEGKIQMVGEKSTITVNGTLDSGEGTVNFMNKNTGADAETNPYVPATSKGADDSRSMTSVGSSVIGTGSNVGVFISAAYFTNEDGYTEYTTVAKAVAAAEAMEYNVTNVDVVGTLNQSDDITLAAGTTLTIDDDAKVALGKVTLTAGANGATGARVISNGQLTATIAGATGVVGSTSESTVELSKAALTAQMISNTNNQNVTSDYLVISGNASGTDPVTYAPVKGAVTVATGTVNAGTIKFDGKGNTLTVATGATLAVQSIGAIDADLIVGNNEKKAAVTVEGTILFSDDGELSMASASVMDVDGTMTVGDEMDISIVGVLNVDGTLAVSTTEDKEAKVTVAANGVLAINGTVTGAVDTAGNTNGGYIKAYAGADLSNAIINMVAGADESQAESTAFYINGNLYMTVYSVDTDALSIALEAEKFELAGVVTYIPGTTDTAKPILDINDVTYWYTDADLTEEAESGAVLGNPEALYFKAPAATAEVTVSVGSGISIYIDDVRYDSGRTVTLAVGTHSVTATVNPGFTGTVNVTFNGQAVTNGQFEITADMASAAYDGVLAISATGDIAQDSTVVIDGGNAGSEMGLTDYLLIILVILIVVMAIIVALRLMRS